MSLVVYKKLLLVLFLFFGVIQISASNVLEFIPDTSTGILIIKNQRSINDFVKTTSTSLQLPIVLDVYDLLGQFSILKDDIDKDGQIGAFVDSVGVVTLWPTKEPMKMLQSLNPLRVAENIFTITLLNDTVWFAQIRGEYLAITKYKEVLETYMLRTRSIVPKLSRNILKAFEDNDVVVCLYDLYKGLFSSDERENFKISDEILDAAESIILSFRCDINGLTMEMSECFREDSWIAQDVIAWKPLNDPLKGLPNMKFVLAGSLSDASALIKNFKKCLKNETIKFREEDIQLSKFLLENEELQKLDFLLQGNTRFALFPGFEDSLFLKIQDVKEPHKALNYFIDLNRKPLPFIGQELGFLGCSQEADRLQNKVIDNAKTVAGVTLTKVIHDVPFNTEMQFFVKELLGQSCFDSYHGICNNSIISISGSDADVEKIVEAIAEGTSPLKEDVCLNKSMPYIAHNPVMIFFYSANNQILSIKHFLTKYCGEIGEKIYSLFGFDAPPIVVSMGVKNRTLTQKIHIPNQTFHRFANAFLQLQSLFGVNLIESAVGENGNSGQQKFIEKLDDRISICDFKEEWLNVTDKGFEDYSSLTRPERVWFNVQILMGIVGNGGLISYYIEDTVDLVFETIDDLKLLGATDFVRILEKMNSLFPDGRPCKKIEDREKIVGNWDGKYEKLLDDLDNEFFRKEDELEKVLIEYLMKNKLISPKITIGSD